MSLYKSSILINLWRILPEDCWICTLNDSHPKESKKAATLNDFLQKLQRSVICQICFIMQSSDLNELIALMKNKYGPQGFFWLQIVIILQFSSYALTEEKTSNFYRVAQTESLFFFCFLQSEMPVLILSLMNSMFICYEKLSLIKLHFHGLRCLYFYISEESRSSLSLKLYARNTFSATERRDSFVEYTQSFSVTLDFQNSFLCLFIVFIRTLRPN